MADYEILCVGIASLYCKQEKKDKVVSIANLVHSIFGDVKCIITCSWYRNPYVTFEVSIVLLCPTLNAFQKSLRFSLFFCLISS